MSKHPQTFKPKHTPRPKVKASEEARNSKPYGNTEAPKSLSPKFSSGSHRPLTAIIILILKVPVAVQLTMVILVVNLIESLIRSLTVLLWSSDAFVEELKEQPRELTKAAPPFPSNDTEVRPWATWGGL